MNKKNSFGAVAGKIWSQYSFIFVVYKPQGPLS